MKSMYFIVYPEKRMFSQLYFPFMYLFLSTVSLFVLPSSLTGLTFKIPSSFLSPDVHFLDRVGDKRHEGKVV